MNYYALGFMSSARLLGTLMPFDFNFAEKMHRNKGHKKLKSSMMMS